LARARVETVWDGRTCGDVLCYRQRLARRARAWRKRTNDLRYESKLSREMLKGSFSASRLRWLEDVVETLDLECQKLGFSVVGDGCSVCQSRRHQRTDVSRSRLGTSGRRSYRQVYAAVIDLWTLSASHTRCCGTWRCRRKAYRSVCTRWAL
jgi:hypothetical protein